MKQNSEIFLLGLDLGTTAIKGVVINEKGNIIAESSRDTRFIIPHDNWFETDPEEYYQDVCQVIRELNRKNSGRNHRFVYGGSFRKCPAYR